MKKIGYLGMGAWGYCLASLLASKKNHSLVCWTTQPELAHRLNQTRTHPLLPDHFSSGHMHFTTDLKEVLEGADLLVESVTSAGIRPVFEQVKAIGIPDCPVVVTSKGIEQNTGRILPEVIEEVLGKRIRDKIGCISGPGFAQEVIKGLPTSLVGSSYSPSILPMICETFLTPHFRVYPNSDLLGVAFGGALKNVIAIACGIADGLGLGSSSSASLMTRGLHEIRKLAAACGCKPETLNGLSGMGDLCLTCHSPLSRNFRFGLLLAQNHSSKEALEKIGSVVEGAYTTVSALQLGKLHSVELPITEIIFQIVYQDLSPKDAVRVLMQRAIKEEHL